MKPQTMSTETFFSLLCFELDLDPETSTEDSVIYAIVQLKSARFAADRAAEINYLEWQKLANPSAK